MRIHLKRISWVDFWVLMLPVTILIVPGGGELAFAVLSFSALFYVVRHRRNPFTVKETCAFSWLLTSYLLVSVVSVLASGELASGFIKLGTSVHFLFAPLLAIYLFDNWNSRAHLFSCIKAGVIMTFLFVLGQWYLGEARPSGALNALVFSSLLVVLSFYAIIRLPWESNGQRLLSVSAFMMGMIALTLSQSRGSWIAAIILFLVLLYLWRRAQQLSNRQLLVIFALLAAAGFAVFFTDFVEKRISKGFDEFAAFYDERQDSSSSIGIRLKLWDAGVKAFIDRPLFGHGIQNTQIAAGRYIDGVDVAPHSHLHNEYITTMVGRGVLGLIALLVLFLFPVMKAIQSLRTKEDYSYPWMIILLCTGYAMIGMTNLALGQGVINSFFIFFLALLMPRIRLGKSGQ